MLLGGMRPCLLLTHWAWHIFQRHSIDERLISISTNFLVALWSKLLRHFIFLMMQEKNMHFCLSLDTSILAMKMLSQLSVSWRREVFLWVRSNMHLKSKCLLFCDTLVTNMYHNNLCLTGLSKFVLYIKSYILFVRVYNYSPLLWKWMNVSIL